MESVVLCLGCGHIIDQSLKTKGRQAQQRVFHNHVKWQMYLCYYECIFSCSCLNSVYSTSLFSHYTEGPFYMHHMPKINTVI